MEQRDGTAEDFAALFEKSLSGMEKLRPGQMVETTIVSIAGDTVFLQLSGKSEGVMERAELVDRDGDLTAQEGDTIKAYFLYAKNGELRFTTKISGDKAGSAMLENAFASKIPVEGLVEREIKGGYEVRLGDSRAFCPFSQMGLRRTADSAAYVGKRLTFQIQEYKEGGRRILVSNRAIEEAAQAVRTDALKQTLHEGMVVKGPIASIQAFGAFVDIGGFQALLPVSEIGRNRVEDIRAVLAVGQEIEAEIIKLDWANERVTLSLKSLLADPWETAKEKYPKGSRLTGTVARVAEFGAFIQLEPGLDGLLHVSELRSDGRTPSARAAFTVGQSVAVQVIEVDASRKRISLRPASSADQDETTQRYLDNGSDDAETYNPFAALLKKK